MFGGGQGPEIFAEVIAASVPGVLVALLTYWLTIRHESELARRSATNERALLHFELEHNRAALAAFWQTIKDLAKAQSGEIEYEGLAAIAAGGLLGQIAPHWSFGRWKDISAQALARLSEKDLAEIDQFYRNLRTFSALFSQLITLQPEERTELDKNWRFWPNRYAPMRQGTFDRLTALVDAILSARDPLS